MTVFEKHFSPKSASFGGWKRWRDCGLALLAFAFLGWLTMSARAETLLNVSYDPTREFYKEFNSAFAADWKAKTGKEVIIKMSHGGSGKQARAVIDGLEADVVTLALGGDIDAIADRTGKIAADWQKRLPNNASPFTSTIVFLVRAGNPKGIRDWSDLANPGVVVITPNPKTSGGARWNYLAAWAYAAHAGKSDAEIRAFVGGIYRNAPVLDTAARGSTMTFALREIGDVLITWENEAFLAKRAFGEDRFELIMPSLSISAETPVSLVDANVKAKGHQALAEAYLAFHYTDAAQAMGARHFFRPSRLEAAAQEDRARFKTADLVTIDKAFGGWREANALHFAKGGVFDQIYERK
jgi:sulfate/thiosulfate transport system substrate-binding protein